MENLTEGVVDVTMYSSASNFNKNKGYVFVEYECHRAAAMARERLKNDMCATQLWNRRDLVVEWAEPELEVDEDVMAKVRVLFVRNLMPSTTEKLIFDTFLCYASVQRVKIQHYAFVTFFSHDGAIKAMEALDG